MNKIKQALYSWYYIRNIQHDDVLLSSFPKSGNTWVAFLIASLQKEAYGIKEKVNFFTIQHFIPETTAPWGSIPAKRDHRIRVIKTHEQFRNPFRRVIWLVRDPRKVLRSYYSYLIAMGILSRDLDFLSFTRLKEFGIDAWIRHAESYALRARPNRGIRMYRYEDVLSDTLAQLRDIANLLGIGDCDLDYCEIIKRCSREKMRELEESTRKSGLKLDLTEDYNFVGTDRKFPKSEAADIFILEQASSLMREFGYL